MDNTQNLVIKPDFPLDSINEIEALGKLGSYFADYTHNTIRISKGLSKILGYEEKSMCFPLNNFLYLHVHTDDIDKIKNPKIVDNSCNAQYKIIKHNKSIAYIINRSSYKLDENGKILNCTGIIQDITEEKLAKLKLEYDENMFRQVTEKSYQIVYAIDLSGKFLYCSPNVKKYLGYETSEVINNNQSYFTDKKTSEMLFKARKKVLKTKKPLEIKDYIIYHKDGSKRWNNTNLFYIKDCISDLDLVVGIVKDITSTKIIEDKLEENHKKLKESLEYDKLKTEFLANISHELRTPINIIFSSLQLFNIYLNNELTYESVNKLKYYSKIMKQNSYRLLRLINNLIESSKIDAGFLSLNKKNCDIVSLILNICSSVKDYIHYKNLNFSYSSDIKEKVLRCDPDQIERIILNLLSNAVKFSKNNGHINLRIYEEDNNIVISVKDDGIGICKEKQSVIFDRFRQAHPLLTRNHEGSGIGLSLVKSLVTMHDGEIIVNSEENIGSEFILRFPIKTNNNDVEEKKDNETLNSNHIEKISIEFSDIYDL